MGIPVSLAFALALGIRACLRDHPEALLFVTAQSFGPFTVIYVLPAAIVAGIAIGCFARPKVLVGLALGLIGVAFGVGYIIGPDGGCVISW